MLDSLIGTWQLCLWDWGAEASRGGRYLEVNYELAGAPSFSRTLRKGWVMGVPLGMIGRATGPKGKDRYIVQSNA